MKKSNYGWIICAACCLQLFCVNGLLTTGFSAYQPYLISIGGLSNTQSSTVITFRTLFILAGMLLTTPLIRRLEIRRLVTIGMLLCAGSLCMYGAAESFAGYCLAASIAGLSVGLGGMIPASVLITRWFNEHRGFALGICMAATGMSAIAASPFITRTVQAQSLRFAFFTEAGFVFICTFIVYLVLRSNPSCVGASPVGAAHIEAAKTYAKKDAPPLLAGLMMLGVLVFGMPGNNLYSHISVLYQSVNFDSMQISSLLSIFGISLAIGKCVYGLISDKIGPYRASRILYILTVAGAGLCCLAGNGSFIIAAAGMITMGFGLAITTVSLSIYASGVSTEKNCPATISRYQMLSNVGALVFGTVPGILADITGDYIAAFFVMMLLSAIGAVILLTTYRTIRKLDSENCEA